VTSQTLCQFFTVYGLNSSLDHLPATQKNIREEALTNKSIQPHVHTHT